jgi:phosphoesterase RecJ-like protein
MESKINGNEVCKFKKAIENSHNIAVIAHKNPDGDAFGSVLSLHEYLLSIGKNSIPITVGPILPKYYFMEGIEQFQNNFHPDNFDLIISCDSGAEIMTGYYEQYPKLFEHNPKLVNIDHHTSNNFFGTINIIDQKAPSTTYILNHIFYSWQIKITKTMATNLLTGICTDTGSFMHTNTTSNVYRVSAKLIALGGDLNVIRQSLFKNNKISSLRAWGKVFDNLYLDNGVAISAITKIDLAECNAKYEDLNGVIDFLNSIPEAKYALLLAEKDELVKGSLRTQKEIDLDKIAAIFGGGGHKKAAGFAIPGHLEAMKLWKIVHD